MALEGCYKRTIELHIRVMTLKISWNSAWWNKHCC